MTSTVAVLLGVLLLRVGGRAALMSILGLDFVADSGIGDQIDQVWLKLEKKKSESNEDEDREIGRSIAYGAHGCTQTRMISIVFDPISFNNNWSLSFSISPLLGDCVYGRIRRHRCGALSSCLGGGKDLPTRFHQRRSCPCLRRALRWSYSGTKSLRTMVEKAFHSHNLFPLSTFAFSRVIFALLSMCTLATLEIRSSLCLRSNTIACCHLSIQGAVLSALGATLGSLVGFFLARTTMAAKVEKALAGQPVARALAKVVEEDGFKTVFVLRLAPVLPIPLGGYSYIYGASKLSPWQFAPATFLGGLKPYLLDSYLGVFSKQLLDNPGTC